MRGDGVPAESGPALEALIDEKLRQADMADWAVPLVVEPELEAWVFSTSPHVSAVLGWKGSSSIRKTLEEQNLWKAEDSKPTDPKAALEYILGRTGKSRSSSLFRRLASRVSTSSGCQDRAFLRLKTLLQGWFPSTSSTSGGGQPGGPFTRGANTVEYETRTRRKLIEVALPLNAINSASARDKSIRHGHPSTLHLWWARRPLAAARAVIFAQMVDDPSANPALFPTEKAQEEERERLFGIIRELVKWENTTNETVLQRAREEIRESWVRTCSENAEHPRAAELFDPDRLPTFHDPFAGGGALPLEAQRLGLEAYASDLNPVAVLINKAMIEKSPIPAFGDVDAPLASTFMLSTKKGKEAYVEPAIERRGYRFEVKVGAPPDPDAAKRGTKSGGSHSSFCCLMSGTPMPFEYLRAEANAGRLDAQLMRSSPEESAVASIFPLTLSSRPSHDVQIRVGRRPSRFRIGRDAPTWSSMA